MLGAVMFGHEQMQAAIHAINDLVAAAGAPRWNWQPPSGDETVAGERTGLAPSPEDEAMARELFARIDAEMAALPPAQRRALWLREIDGLDYQAIADAMAQPVNTVKSHIHRARETISARLRPLLAPSRHRRW
jgi:RNA polymerase sigma factor (sigma-70 family)